MRSRPASCVVRAVLLGAALAGASDWAVNAKYFGLTYHPDGGEHEGYPRKLDDAAYWVMEVGSQVDAEYMVRPWLSVRTSHSLYRDCADVWAGFDNVGFRLVWPATDRLSLRIGIGPTFIWRQTWLGVVEGYHRDSFFGAVDSSADFQHAFLWYGGDLEASWMFDKRWGLVVSTIPGWPEVISTAIGVRREF